jgi:hypothetical protein
LFARKAAEHTRQFACGLTDQASNKEPATATPVKPVETNAAVPTSTLTTENAASLAETSDSTATGETQVAGEVVNGAGDSSEDSDFSDDSDAAYRSTKRQRTE